MKKLWTLSIAALLIMVLASSSFSQSPPCFWNGTSWVCSGNALPYPLQTLTEDPPPSATDIVVTVKNPLTVPMNRKIQLGNLWPGLAGMVNSGMYATLTSAHAAAVAAGKGLYITSSLTFTGSLTSTVPIMVAPGSGRITQTGTGLLTFDASFNAGLCQVFYGFSSGQVRGLTYATPTMFGAIAGLNYSTLVGTDNSTAFQCAIASVLTTGTGGSVYVPAGGYYLASQVLITNGVWEGFNFYGAGEGATVLAGSHLITGGIIKMASNGATISDMEIIQGDVSSGMGAATIALEIAPGSNGVSIHNLWLSSCTAGLKIGAASANIRVHNIHAEHNLYDYWIDRANMIQLSLIQSYRAVYAGLYITGTYAGMEKGAITVSDPVFVESPWAGGGTPAISAAIHIDSYIPVILNAPQISHTNIPGAVIWEGIHIVSGNVLVNNPSITKTATRGIGILAGSLTVMGGRIEQVGYLDQTGPWITQGIYAAPGTSLTVMGTYINSEGYGIYSQAKYSKIQGVTFNDCSNGGQTGTVNATTGNKTLVLDPQTTDTYAEVIGNHFSNDTSAATGKTAFYLFSSAVPAAGNLKIIGNNATLNSFATKFATGLTNAQLLTYDITRNTGLLKTTAHGSNVIAAAATSVVIAHGLDVTPLAENITITGTNTTTAPIGAVWVDTIGATYFTVHCTAVPGVTTWTFGWKIETN